MTLAAPQEFIRHKRDGHAHAPSELAAFVAGLSDGTISEAQVAAWAMAVFFRGLTPDECRALTRAMRDSGARLDWSAWGFSGPIVDKHSTGGVGDKVSLILAPLLAACGAIVPMIAGRGLGHTGGTIDKLEAIPGYRTTLTTDELGRVLGSVGCAIVGQSAALAPADRRFYAIRDVTATVESVPLITASILSKKLAAGLQHLLIDLKVGNGAFADRRDVAQALGRSLVEVAGDLGLPTRACLTDMNQVLGASAGNTVEVLEAIAFLTGDDQDPRLLELTLTLAAELLAVSGLARASADGRQRAEQALRSGAALESFARMVAAMGGPADLVDHPEQLPTAPVVREVIAPRPGFVESMDTRAIGRIVMDLGGGRRRTEDPIDPRVGLDRLAGIGGAVGPDAAPLARIHAADEAAAHRAEQALLAAFRCGDRPTSPSPLILELLEPSCSP